MVTTQPSDLVLLKVARSMELSGGACPSRVDYYQPVVAPDMHAGVISASEQDSIQDASVTVSLQPFTTHKSHEAAAECPCQQHQADYSFTGPMQKEAARADSSSTTGVLVMPDSSTPQGTPQQEAGAPMPPPASIMDESSTEAPTPPASTTGGALPQATCTQVCSPMPASIPSPAATEKAAVAHTQEPQVADSATQSPAQPPAQSSAQSSNPTGSMGPSTASSPGTQGGCSGAAQSPDAAVSTAPIISSSPSTKATCSLAAPAAAAAAAGLELQAFAAPFHPLLTEQTANPAAVARMAAASSQPAAARPEGFSAEQHALGACRTDPISATLPRMDATLTAVLGIGAAAASASLAGPQSPPGSAGSSSSPHGPATPEDSEDPGDSEPAAAAVSLLLLAAPSGVQRSPVAAAVAQDSPKHSAQHSPQPSPAAAVDAQDSPQHSPQRSPAAAAAATQHSPQRSPAAAADVQDSPQHSAPLAAAAAQDSPQHSPQQQSPSPAAAVVEDSSQHSAHGSAPSMQDSDVPAPQAAPQVVKIAHRELVYYGPLVCSLCGALGHAANTCRTAFCTQCCFFGHDAAR